MGLGFTVGLVAIGLVREILGSGKAFGAQIIPVADAATGAAGYTPITIFILAPGAFLVLAGLAAIQNKVKINMAKKGQRCFQDPVWLRLQLCDLRRMSF